MPFNHFGKARGYELAVGTADTGEHCKGPIIIDFGLGPLLVNKYNATSLPCTRCFPLVFNHVEEGSKEFDEVRWCLLESFINQLIMAGSFSIAKALHNGGNFFDGEIFCQEASRIVVSKAT